ncbi:nucleoid-associated protein [Actinomadura sp. WMMA1423]|uniref:nucleoid-associated protein n=1 Tax=Actinomadura sp. WMMA1423 TaxID=2591108 RepID=UPI001147933C|nr:nucleoid-associated protein [Actinomadura sp. WMMA1423]
MDLSTLRLRQVILHQVSQGKNTESAVSLSEVPTPLNDQNRPYFELRLRKALTRNARPVVEEPGAAEICSIIRNLLQGEGDLVADSQQMTKNLQKVQRSHSPTGILLTSEASINDAPALIIAKVEHEQGVRATTTTVDGRTTFSVEFLRDLLFTSTTKVFKVAVFSSLDSRDGLLYGHVSDSQASGAKIARYFLDQYLGCKLVERSDVLTERFYEASVGWINRIDNAEKKAQYQVALLSEMQSNRSEISIDRFALDYLDSDDRDDFRNSLIQADVPPRQLEKSIDLIKSHIQKVKIETQNDVLVLAPTSSLDDGTVTIEDHDNGESEVRVHDRVKKISGSGGFSVKSANDA